MMDTEALARELHDVAFTWNSCMLPWDSLPDAQQEWFRERAEGIAAENECESPSPATTPMRFTREQAREAVRRVSRGADNTAPTWWRYIRKALGIPPAYTPPPFSKSTPQVTCIAVVRGPDGDES